MHLRWDSVDVETRRRVWCPQCPAILASGLPIRVFTLRDVRNDGAGHPALVFRQRIHRLAAASFVVPERLWPALNECATYGNNLDSSEEIVGRFCSGSFPSE